MNPEELFGANLDVIDRVVASVCRRASLRDVDAEDFASTVKLALIENDYAILRAYEGRSSLETFLTVVARRLLSRERTRIWGRWNASAEAERLGAAAVLLEKLLTRDRLSLEEATPIVLAFEPSLARADVRALAGRLPPRTPRPRLVSLPETGDPFEADDRADARAEEAEARRISEHAARVVRQALASLPLQDRMLVRFRFGADLSIADVSRLLGVPQRPLYRRIEALLRQLRVALEREGVSAKLVADVISSAASEGADFGLHGKTEAAEHTKGQEGLR